MFDEIPKIVKPVDGALYLFNLGYKVFPIRENKKTPSFNNWQDWAKTADEKKIRNYATAQPMSNWGVFCDKDLLVVDIDNKNNKKGNENWNKFVGADKEINNSLSVMTPTKGVHIYYKGQGKTSANRLTKDVDTRGEGGYVIAPGSRIDNKAYEIYNDNVIQLLPSFVERKLDEKIKPKTIQENEHIEEGERNAFLASLAGTMRSRGMDYEAIILALMSTNETKLGNPLPNQEVENIARSISKYAPDNALVASDFEEFNNTDETEGFDEVEYDKILARDWVMKGRYVGGYISVIIAPGGLGKSTLSMLDATAILTGRNLSGSDIVKPGGVWLYNTEDPKAELRRKQGAILAHHEIKRSEITGYRYSSGRDKPLILVKNSNQGMVIMQNVIDHVINIIKKRSIVLLIADPFVRTHEVNENDNMQIDKVVWAFQHIADKTGCAVCLVHHTRKPGNNGASNGDMHTARGASSLINAARVAHTVSPMTEPEAKKFGIGKEKRKWYFRLDDAKSNLTPPAEHATWFKKIDTVNTAGDHVGTLECVDLCDMSHKIKAEEIEIEREDLGMCLSDAMEIGDKRTINDIWMCLSGREDFNHIMGIMKSRRRGVPKLIHLLNNGLCYKDKYFIHTAQEIGIRMFHYIECSTATKDQKALTQAHAEDTKNDFLL